MKYTGEEISKKDSLKKHADLIKENDVVFATSDGNAFIGERAKTNAYAHCANYRPCLHVFDLKNDAPDTSNDAGGSGDGGEEEVTVKSLMKKYNAVDLQAEADKIGATYETDANKATVAQSILDKLAEADGGEE